MNEVIAKLYEIDKEACTIFEKARSQKNEIQAQLEQEEASATKAMMDEMQSKLELLRTKLETSSKGQIQELKTSTEKQIDRLNATYDDHLEELAHDFLKRMIEV
ncbi:hypothetical protein LQZ18_13590 [Lachnospiraceae bacterium ZAX-1]